MTARLVLENARVVDGRGPGVAGSAIAIVGARVAAIGDRSDAVRAAGPGARRVDVGGATVVPGIVDPHLHLFGLAARDAHLDCAPFADVDALLDAVAARAAALPPGSWVRGEALDERRLRRLPTAAELERAGGGRPVRLRHRSRHASVLSTGALARLPPRLPGVERAAGGATGLVSGEERVVGAIVGRLPRAELEAGLERASRMLLALGVTTVADATPRRLAGLAPLRRAIARGAFAPRVFAMRPWNAPAWRPSPRLRPGPAKVMVDETPSGLVPAADVLRRRIARAAADGAQVAVHCTGAATLVAALAAFAALPLRDRRGRRHRLEHLGECPPSLVARVAALDLVVVTNPAFVYWQGDVYREETPPPAHGWLYRARSLVRAGIPVAAASDAPVVPPDPWRTIATARARRTRGGAVLGGAERVDAATALALVTRHAARALRADALGVLRLGGPADLAVVTPDPLRATPAAVAGTRVLLTVVGGAIAWEA